MNHRFDFFLLAFLVASVGFSAEALGPPQTVSPLRQKCATRKTEKGRPWKYCAYEYPNSSHDILWYFHGLTGSERSFKLERLEREMISSWIQTGKPPPIVVSVSFGGLWFLVEKNQSPASGLFEIFHDEVVPHLESTLGFKVRHNYLMGVSMGGFNAAQLYFKSPQFHFRRAALICPATSTVSPFAGAQAAQEYRRRTGAKAVLLAFSQFISNDFMPTVLAWNRHSPLLLGAEGFSSASPPLYVANGLKDEFGFQDGNLALVEIARARGTLVTADFFKNQGHCGIDGKAIGRFLALDEISPP